MISDLPPRERDWLEIFFSERNFLTWESINLDNAPTAWLEQVIPWITAFIESGCNTIIVLPVFDSAGPCQWYGMAADERSASALSQELTAAVGPSYSDFWGPPVQTDLEDRIEHALLNRFGRHVFRLTPVSRDARGLVTQSLNRYLGLLKRRPAIPDRTQRPFGRIRGEFDRALLVGNESDARNLREELVLTGRLNAEQLKYLEIRMLAGLGYQQQLAHDYTLIRSMLDLPLPAQTLTDLVGALYDTYIAGIENESELEVILADFRQKIAQPFGPLFKERKGIRQANVLKAFLLFELSQPETNGNRCAAILESYPTEIPGRSLVESWYSRAAVASTATRQPILNLIRQAIADEDYDAALNWCYESLPEPFAYSGLMRCAVELGDTNTRNRVLGIVNEAPRSVSSAWTTRDLARLEQLRSAHLGAAQAKPDTDWLSWVSYVEMGNYNRLPLEILDDAFTRWNPETYASNALACQQLADAIGNASGKTEQTFRDAFPKLVEFFVNRLEHPVRAFLPIYLMLIRTVAWNGAVSRNELELASTVVGALVSLGPTTDDYTESIEAYSEVLSANSAPNNLDWALNASEMLAIYPSPNTESRLRFFIGVIEMARAMAHRLNSAQRAMLTLQAKDYECASLLDSLPPASLEAETNTHSKFDGLIGIYTLTETAGQRAQQFLRTLLPMARVEVNADLVATDRLKQLAMNADIFVFAWKSSKHQAYFAVKEARRDKDTLLPLGKGSASILGSVLGELGRVD